MRKVTKVSLISLRETTLLAHLAMSLGLCYMLAETISIFIQYFFHTDIVLTYDVYRYAFIYPNVILLTFLFIWIHRKPTIKVKYLIFIPPAYYAVHYLLVLLFAGVKNVIGWNMYGGVGSDSKFHLGLRDYYCSLMNRFYERINLWDATDVLALFVIVILLYVVIVFLFVFLRNYIRRNTQSAAFAEPIHQK